MNLKFIGLAKRLNIYLNHFPKHEKYALAQQIRNAAYDVYGMIVEGQKRYHKKTTLTQLDIRHEQLRMYVALAHELGYFGFSHGRHGDDAGQAARRYCALSCLIDELGRMIGGWIKREMS